VATGDADHFINVVLGCIVADAKAFSLLVESHLIHSREPVDLFADRRRLMRVESAQPQSMVDEVAFMNSGSVRNGAKISGFVVVFSGKKTRPHDAR
jgi:hypothetical protein